MKEDNSIEIFNRVGSSFVGTVSDTWFVGFDLADCVRRFGLVDCVGIVEFVGSVDCVCRELLGFVCGRIGIGCGYLTAGQIQGAKVYDC